MREDILTWLRSGANAQEGVQLLNRAGAPSLAITMVSSNPEIYRQMMVDWLLNRFDISRDVAIVRQSASVVVYKERQKPLREDFPFLGKPNCPVELEALASRKISKYHNYVELHAQLRSCSNLDECARIARAVLDNYMENRAIWQEMHYYQEHGKVLGKHPIFHAYARRKNLLSMSIKDLMVRKQQLDNNIWRVQSEIKKGNKPHLDAQRRERLEAYQSELAEVNRLLDE